MGKFQLSLKKPFEYDEDANVEVSTESLTFLPQLTCSIETLPIDPNFAAGEPTFWGIVDGGKADGDEKPKPPPENRIVSVMGQGDGTTKTVFVFITKGKTFQTDRLSAIISTLTSKDMVHLYMADDLPLLDVPGLRSVIEQTAATTMCHLIRVRRLASLVIAAECTSVVASPLSIIHVDPSLGGQLSGSHKDIANRVSFEESLHEWYTEKIVERGLLTSAEVEAFKAGDSLLLLTGDLINERMAQ